MNMPTVKALTIIFFSSLAFRLALNNFPLTRSLINHLHRQTILHHRHHPTNRTITLPPLRCHPCRPHPEFKE